MRLASPVNLGAAKISTADIYVGVQFKAGFSEDFLGTFIEAPTAKDLMEHARFSEGKVADPFIQHQANTLAKTLAQDKVAKRFRGVQDDLRLILAFWEVKKAPWWHCSVILEGLKSLFRTTKKAEVKQVKDDYISVPSPLEFAKAEIEKLSKKVDELHEDHLHNKNQIDLKAREEDHRIYLSAKKYIEDAYHACLAEIESSKKSEATAFMEGFQATSHLDQQPSLLRSRSNEQLLIKEEAEESVNSIISDTSSSDNQIVSQISMPSRLTGENIVEAQSFAKALEILKTFSRKGIELKSPESGLVKKAHDFIHHDTMSEVVATGSAIAHMAAPGSGLAVNSGAILVRSIARGIMYSDSSFREVEYKNAFRMQLKNNIDFAIHEVEDMFSPTGAANSTRAAAFAAAGMASGAINTTLIDNTEAMRGMSDKMDNFVTQEQLASTVEKAVNTAMGKVQEDVQGLKAGVGQLVEIARPLLGSRRNSIDSGVGLSRTGSSSNLNGQHQASASPVITENMQAGQSLRAQSTSPEAQRPTTPEIEELKKELNNGLSKVQEEFKQTIAEMKEQHAKEKAELREEAKKQQEEMFARIAGLFAAQQPQQPN